MTDTIGVLALMGAVGLVYKAVELASPGYAAFALFCSLIFITSIIKSHTAFIERQIREHRR